MIGFAATFGYHYINKMDIEDEKPCYSSTINVYVTSEFDNYSILKSSEIAFSEESINMLKEYEGLSNDTEDIIKSIQYSAESKYILQIRVYAKDSVTLAKVVDGLINVSLPIIKESSNASDINHSLEEKEIKVKIGNYENYGGVGLVDMTDRGATLWSEYLSSVSLFKIIKNSVVISVCAVFIVAIIIVLKRMLTSKLITPNDVEAATQISLMAVVDDAGNGVEFVEKKIKANFSAEKSIALLPVLRSEKVHDVVKALKTIEDAFIEVHPFSDSTDILNKIKDIDAVIVLYEDLKTTDVQMINTIEALYASGMEEIGIVAVNVKLKKIKKDKAYFGKYYQNCEMQ